MDKTRIVSTEEQEANFREICMGTIMPKTLFRSSHPIKDNAQERAHALLAAREQIASVLNLCGTESGLNSKVFFTPWYNKLYKNKRVIALGMDFSFTGSNFIRKLKKALQFIISSQGPYLIHCHAGVDRTGFVSMVLESLMGATIKEIAADYLESYNNTFVSSIYTEINKNDMQVVMHLLSVMDDSAIISDRNLQGIAELYLEQTAGLTAGEIALLKGKLSGVQ